VEAISQCAEAALYVAVSITEQSPSRLAAATLYALGCAAPGNSAAPPFLDIVVHGVVRLQHGKHLGLAASQHAINCQG
jgi:hypothetical protein